MACSISAPENPCDLELKSSKSKMLLFPGRNLFKKTLNIFIRSSEKVNLQKISHRNDPFLKLLKR